MNYIRPAIFFALLFSLAGCTTAAEGLLIASDYVHPAVPTTIKVHGTDKSCDDLPELDKALNARDEAYFDDWSEQDFSAADTWVRQCARHPVFGKDTATPARLDILGEVHRNEVARQKQDNARASQAAAEREANQEKAEMEAVALANWVGKTIVTERRLDDICHGRESAATNRACASRDKYVNALMKKGWCYGHDPQINAMRDWEPCASRSEGGDIYLKVQSLYEQQQIERCRGYIDAGNRSIGTNCLSTEHAAAMFLHDEALHSPLPTILWGQCMQYVDVDIETTARCIIAAEQICRFEFDGEIHDLYGRCLNTITSGAWITNPVAAEFQFD